MSVLPFIEGRQILEIGHGPGHLQRVLLNRGLVAVGIDESAQMGHLAKRNLRREAFSRSHNVPSTEASSASSFSRPAYSQINLTRGVAQHLPFPNGIFNTVVATFPAEYIFDPITLTEAQRVLMPGGKFVILPGAAILGRGAADRLLAWIFRITGETPPNLAEMLRERTQKPFTEAGFHVEVHEIMVRSTLVFIVLATKIQIRENLQYA